MEYLLDFRFFEGEGNIHGQRVGNDREGRWRQVPNLDQIARSAGARSDLDLRKGDRWGIQPSLDLLTKSLQKSFFLGVRNPDENDRAVGK